MFLVLVETTLVTSFTITEISEGNTGITTTICPQNQRLPALKIVVTGASGLLGQHILRALSQALPETEITACYHNTPPPQQNSSYVQWQKLDLDSPAAVMALVQGKDVVVHAAGMVSFSKKDAAQLEQVNILGTRLLVDTLLQCSPETRLVHISSVAALGKAHIEGAHAGFIDENSAWDSGATTTLYAKSKWNAELEVWRGVQEGLKAVILNPAIILAYDASGRSSASIIDYVLKNKPFYTHGYINYVDAEDVAQYTVWACTTAPVGKRFVLSAGHTTYAEFFNTMARALGVKGPTLELKPWLANIGWRAAAVWSLFTGKTPLITRETVRTAFRKSRFRGTTVTEVSGIPYSTFQQSLARIKTQVQGH